MAIRAEVRAFIAEIAPIVVNVCKSKSKKILPSVCIAQACCESAYGTSTKMIKANAVFGIKVGSKSEITGTLSRYILKCKKVKTIRIMSGITCNPTNSIP